MELKKWAIKPRSFLSPAARVPETSNSAFQRAPTLLTSAGILLSSVAIASAGDFERPKFRGGLWHFERTVEYVRRPPNENLVVAKTDVTRCVDPNVAMATIFSSAPVGNCRSEPPQRFDNQYVFGNRCDFMGPVSTVITAESDSSYSEVNLLVAEPLPKRDTVIAHRIGDCGVASAADEVSGARARRR